MPANEILAKTVPFYAVAIAVVALRCWVRVRIVKSFGHDDWVMIGAAVRF